MKNDLMLPHKYYPYKINSHHHTSNSSKKLSQAKLDRYHNSHTNIGKADLKAFIDIIPKDQRMIEQYIQQLKEKLQQMRSSPKKKNTARLQKQEIFKRKTACDSKMKSKTKSVTSSSAAKQISKSLNLRVSRQMEQKIGLHNFKKMRDDYKRSKLHTGNDRLDTEKQNNRYIEQKNIKTQAKPMSMSSQKQATQLRFRANTEEVIRNQRNPARIYRYSSQKKSQHFEPDEGKVKNNFIFDKFINVSHNINIYPRSSVKPQRLRKQIEQQIDYPHKNQQKSPKKGSPKRNIDKLNQKSEKLQDISTINARKQTINFLGQSCLQIKEQLQKPQSKQVEKLLDFIGWRTIQMKKALANGKQKKRKNGLDKLVKIFPKGFFA